MDLCRRHPIFPALWAHTVSDTNPIVQGLSGIRNDIAAISPMPDSPNGRNIATADTTTPGRSRTIVEVRITGATYSGRAIVDGGPEFIGVSSQAESPVSLPFSGLLNSRTIKKVSGSTLSPWAATRNLP